MHGDVSSSSSDWESGGNVRGRSDGGLAGRPGTKKGRDQETKELSLMSLRKELISLMMGEGSNSSQPSARSGISRKTGYKWMNVITKGRDGRSCRSIPATQKELGKDACEEAFSVDGGIEAAL